MTPHFSATSTEPSHAIAVPDFCLVVLIGATGAGKSDFARTWFSDDEIISYANCRTIAGGVVEDTIDTMRVLAEKRLKSRRLVVINAANVCSDDRKPWIELARRNHATPIAIVLEPGVKTCIARNKTQPNIPNPRIAISMSAQVRDGLHKLPSEGFRHIFTLDSQDAINAATIVRTPLPVDRRFHRGGFDVLGDLHGCATELETMIRDLGYTIAWSGKTVTVSAPHGRTLVFAGDLIDRGPRNADTLRIVMATVKGGCGLVVAGNHDSKFHRWLTGHTVSIRSGLQSTIDQFESETPEFRAEVIAFLGKLPSHYWLDGGDLVVCHAGIKEDMIGCDSVDVSHFTRYGETNGEVDDMNFPVRRDWARDYKGHAHVVYGHTTVSTAQWVGRTICIDTGCVFGGSLTALRWPERTIHSVPAETVHYQARQLEPAT